jgi:phytoene dehydrogenase-like protein
VCNVTPTQLYETLLVGADIPPRIRDRATRFRYGRGGMMIHIALKQRPRWKDSALDDAAMVHVVGDIETVAGNVRRQADRCQPAPTVAVGQPCAVDLTAPDGGWILWMQVHELPSRIVSDAGPEGSSAVPAASGRRPRGTSSQRVIDRVARAIPELGELEIGGTCSDRSSSTPSTPTWWW